MKDILINTMKHPTPVKRIADKKRSTGHTTPSEALIPKIWEKALLETVERRGLLFQAGIFGKIIGYKKVKVAVWETEKRPYIEKYYGEGNDEGEYNDELEGYLIRFKEKKIKKIGYKWEEEPIYEKPKKSGNVIKFKRYETKK